MSHNNEVKPYNCLEVHVAFRTLDEKMDRWAKVAEWIANDSWPQLMPAWLLKKKDNHGGGGGP